VIPLEEIPADGHEWEAERRWIEKYADLGLFNKYGNPYWSPKLRGSATPSAVAA
jgi:hypothetical protein